MGTLCQITMDCGHGIDGSTIRWNLKQNADKFDRVIVVDGNLTERAKEFYSQFPNLEWVDSPWNDSYVNQYHAWKNKLQVGEWALYLDCDEVPSMDLMNFCGGTSFRKNIIDIYKIPCILHLTEDGKHYFASEPEPAVRYANQWTKNIFIKNSSNVYFRHFGSHVISEVNGGKYDYKDAPYFHMKSLESFIRNDVYQAFLSPEGQGYGAVEGALFKKFAQYTSTKDFKKATAEGRWSPALQRFAWERRWEVGRPISRLAWTYFILHDHPHPEKDERFTWDNVKGHVLSRETMLLYEDSKKNNNGIVIEEM